MCGIVGFLSPDGIADEHSALRVLTSMSEQLVHRGPNGGGAWLDAEHGLALGARRLSILDLSTAGDQPFVSADGRYVVAMNGEIYNFPELRAEIELIRGKHTWRGRCDVEVLAEAIALWGVEKAISQANGMFGLAVWDRRERELWLARDRIGKKPVYYGWAGNTFVFASEMKALWQHPDFDATVSVEALAGFLQLGYVLGEQAFFAGIKRLPAGHLLRVDGRALRSDIPSPTPYWRLRDIALAGIEAQASGQIPDEDELASLIEDAVARRMVADVPVGSLLSGGIDSSLVTALMQAGSHQQVRTFTIGFTATGWNEAQHANAVAKHLATRHEEHYVSTAEVMEVVRDIPRICDEPFADNSIIPTILLSRMARQSVIVALSGDGGDELFVGYDRYGAVDRLFALRAHIPSVIRSLARSLNDVSSRPAAARWGSTRLERRLALLSGLLRDGDATKFSQQIMSQQFDVSSLLDVPCRCLPPLNDPMFDLACSTPIDRMTYLDTMSYLVDDILFKMDRASMSASLEVRCPLLDHRVIEMSWRFPSAMKCSGTIGKLPLRNILYRHVPQSIVDRPKMGFCAPVEIWLKNELRDWAEALMTREMLADTGLLNVGTCRKLWEDFTTRGRGWNPALWNILMFQSWHQEVGSMRRPTFR